MACAPKIEELSFLLYTFILETLSQYAALMVLKNNYPEEKVAQFLVLQKEIYEKERKKEKVKEPSLVLVENQDYIYYNKGAIAMYKLQKPLFLE